MSIDKHKNIQGQKFENLSIHDQLCYIVQIFCNYIYDPIKLVFIMSDVAQVSDVAQGPLVLFIKHHA